MFEVEWWVWFLLVFSFRYIKKKKMVEKSYHNNNQAVLGTTGMNDFPEKIQATPGKPELKKPDF